MLTHFVSLPFNRRFRLLRLAALLACFPFATPALAGQTVTINSDPGDSVYGNGDLPNGSVPAVFPSGLKDPHNNTVIINSEVTNGSVYGAYLNNQGGFVTGNNVTISGGTVKGWVVGGFADGSSQTATHNTVTLSGSPTVSSADFMEGLSGGGASDVFTGNTSNVWDYSGTAVHGAADFQYYNFVFPATQGSAPVLAANYFYLGNGKGTGSTATASTLGSTAQRCATTGRWMPRQVLR